MDGGVLAHHPRMIRDFGGSTFLVRVYIRIGLRKGIGSALRQLNVVISRFKAQLKLESLILAQNERWRQA